MLLFFLCIRNNLVLIDLSHCTAIPDSMSLRWKLKTYFYVCWEEYLRLQTFISCTESYLRLGKGPSVFLKAPASSLPTFLIFVFKAFCHNRPSRREDGTELLLKSSSVVPSLIALYLLFRIWCRAFSCLCWGTKVCGSRLAFSQLWRDYWNATLPFQFWGLIHSCY